MSTLNVDTLQDKAGAFEHARLVQVVNVLNVTMTTGTTAMVHDNTIPQNDEGDQCLILAITPTNTNNNLLIEVGVQFAINANVAATCALFQDDTAGALTCVGTYGANGTHTTVHLSHFISGSIGTSETEFKVRIGGSSGTCTINGVGGARKYGGVCTTAMTISEIRV